MKKILLAVLFYLCGSNFTFAGYANVSGFWMLKKTLPSDIIAQVEEIKTCPGKQPTHEFYAENVSVPSFIVISITQSSDGTFSGHNNMYGVSNNITGKVTGDTVSFESTMTINAVVGQTVTVIENYNGTKSEKEINGILNGTFNENETLSIGGCSYQDIYDASFSGTFNVDILGGVDPETRFLDKADLSRQVTGAVADDASKVVIQITSLPEDITSDNIQISIPEGETDGRLENDKKISNGVFTQTYVVPACFVRNDHPEDLTDKEREVGLSIMVKDEQIDHEPFTLVRPPVVLLHGLWAADTPIWTGLKAYLKSNGFNVVNDDPYPDDRSFKQNHYVVRAHVDRALAEAQRQGLVAKKADVVGHSMGGILIKKYGDSSYIRRVVTIGTPHLGSPWANWLLKNPWLEGILNWDGKSMNHGAISDLQTGVCNVLGDSLKVPVLAIAGKSSSDTFPGEGGDIFSAIFSLATLGLVTPSKVHTALFGTDTSDWVVSTPSQGGGLPIEKVSGIWHLEEPENSTVFEKVADFLDKTTISATEMAMDLSMPPQIEEDNPTIASFSSQTQVQLTEMGGGITITSPSTGSTYSPGDTITVNMVVPPGTTKVWVDMLRNPAVISQTPPFAVNITVPPEAIGQSRIVAVAWGGEGFLAMTSTVINVTTPASVSALKVWPDSGLYLMVGETVPFVVHGIFSDGIERDITGSECGTNYETTDSLVASIDTEGVLTAKAPGNCFIIVSNGDSMQIPVLVRTSPTVPNVVGLPQVVAEFVITSAGFMVGTITYTYSETIPAGNVISQNPLEGTPIVVNSVVDLVISCTDCTVSHWTLDDSQSDTVVVDDFSRNSGNSQRNTSILHTAGPIDGALSFNGITDKVTVSDSDSLDFGTGDFTVSLWVKMNGFVKKGSAWNSILSKGLISSTDSAFYGFYTNSSNKVYFAVGNDDNYGRSDSVLNDGSFHHIVGLREDGTVYLYVDGVLQTVANSSTINVTNSSNLVMGADSTTTRYFGGVLDDVRIYNKALSEDEIEELYGHTVSHWTLDDNQSDTVVVDNFSRNSGTSQRNTSILHTAGQIDGALSFNGTTDKVTVSDSGTLDFGTSDFTVSLWVKMNGFVKKGSAWNSILSKGLISSSDSAFYGFYTNNSNKVYFAVGNDDNYGRSNSVLNDGSFHHIVGVKENGAVYLYVDGVLQTVTSSSAVNITNSSNLVMGADSAATRYFGGVMDDVRIYNKALSEDAIDELYNH
jgi:hypothetical protein